MRGVLVDDDDAVARLRHDIGLVHLRARGAERPVEQVGRRLAAMRARVGRRRADIESGLRGLGEAGSDGQRGAAAARRHGPRRRAPPVPARRGRGATAGRNAAIVALPPVRRCALAVARERLLQRAHDQRAHQAGVAEAHLGLGRMHVDVDLARIDA